MRRAFILLLLIVTVYPQVQADPPDPVREDVLRPLVRRPAYGFYLGGNAAFSSGTLITTCDCTYESGNGFGPSVGAFIELPIVSELSVVGQIVYHGLNVSYDETEERLEYIDDGDFLFLSFNKAADVAISIVSVDALLKWNIGERSLFVTAGPSFGWLLSGSINEVETLTTPGYTFTTTGSNEKVYIDDEDLGNVYDVNDLHLTLLFGLGYEIPLSEEMVLAPSVVYSLPLSNIANGFVNPVGSGQREISDWKHSSIDLQIRLMLWL